MSLVSALRAVTLRSSSGRNRGRRYLCSRSLTGRRKEAQEHLTEVIGANAVEVVLAFTSRLDEAGNTQQGQVMAHGGLALAEPMAQVSDVELAVGRQGEVEQDAEASLVAQKFEHLGKFADRLIGHFRTGVVEVAVCRG